MTQAACMRRREFIMLLGVATVVRPLVAHAQQSSGKVWRVAFVLPGAWDNPADQALFDLFREELQKLGYVDGKNLVIDRRGAEGHNERLFSLVSELIALGPDVIIAVGAAPTAAAQRATSTIPIVMWGTNDPVGAGFIKSLAHPGGNVTGIAGMFADSIGKSVELLHAVVPSAKRMAVLTSSNPNHPGQYELAAAAGKALGLVAVQILAPSSADLEQAFDRMAQEKCDALFVLADPIRPTIVPLAAKTRIPAVYQFGAYVDLGGLASYGASITPMARQTVQYADKIFKGADPAELPVEQPVVFELALNLKTAAALGLSIPEPLVARADRVIE
jgi:putative tryptophan/tyrosine transport system substrate-binding protein